MSTVEIKVSRSPVKVTGSSPGTVAKINSSGAVAKLSGTPGRTGSNGTNGTNGTNGADGNLIGSYIKAPVKYATLNNITLSGHQAVDGTTQTVDNDTVLVWRQDTPSQNGIYTASSGAWSRHSGMDTAAEFIGAMVLVLSGQYNKGKVFRIRTAPTTLGTDAVYFDEEALGGSLQTIAAKQRGILCMIGDSNTSGRTALFNAMLAEWRNSKSQWANWSQYNHGVSGFTVGTGLLSSFRTGDKNASPVDSNPVAGTGTWDGNIWRAINTQADIVFMSLGINDMNSPTPRSTYGTQANFDANLDEAVQILLTAMPKSQIVLWVPSPYAGEDFVSGSFNTSWASDSPDGTIDTNAALSSSYIRASYLKWANRHPRITVIDTAEIFGTSCNDKSVDSQDPELGAGFPMMDDSLHFSALAGRRLLQLFNRVLGFPTRRGDTATLISNNSLNEQCFWGRWVNYTGLSNSGSDTLLTVRGSPEHVFLEAALGSRRTNSLLKPTYVIEDAERSLFLGDLAFIRGIIGIGRDAKIQFGTEGNIYQCSTIELSSTNTNPDGTFTFVLRLKNVNLGALGEATSGLAFIYASNEGGIPFLRKNLVFNFDGTGSTAAQCGGGAWNPYAVTWQPGTFLVQRGNASNAISVEVYVQNQTDGRLVDGAIAGSPFSSPGALVASGSLINGGFQASLTPNAAIWGSPFAFNFKSDYRLVAKVTSGTLVGQASLMIR